MCSARVHVINQINWQLKANNIIVACTSQAANKRVVNERWWLYLTELHETSTVRTTVYGCNTVQVYVQLLS